MANLFTINENSNNNNSHEPGEHPDKVRFEQEMNGIIPILVSKIEQAHHNMSEDISGKHPNYLSHLSKSVRMHEQIKGLITDEFGDSVKKLKYNRFGLFKGNFVLLFKKLDEFGRPSNIATINSSMLLSTGKLSFPGEPIIVHVGYVVEKSWESIKRIYAVGISNNQVDWLFNLRLGGSSNILSQITTNPSISPEDGLNVVPKNNTKLNKKSS